MFCLLSQWAKQQSIIEKMLVQKPRWSGRRIPVRMTIIVDFLTTIVIIVPPSVSSMYLCMHACMAVTHLEQFQDHLLQGCHFW